MPVPLSPGPFPRIAVGDLGFGFGLFVDILQNPFEIVEFGGHSPLCASPLDQSRDPLNLGLAVVRFLQFLHDIVEELGPLETVLHRLVDGGVEEVAVDSAVEPRGEGFQLPTRFRG